MTRRLIAHLLVGDDCGRRDRVPVGRRRATRSGGVTCRRCCGHLVQGGTIDPLAGAPTAVSCPTARFCAAVTRMGPSSSTTARRGRYPKVSNAGGGGFTSVSCPTVTFCAAVDQNDNALTTTEARGRSLFGSTRSGSALLRCLAHGRPRASLWTGWLRRRLSGQVVGRFPLRRRGRAGPRHCDLP